ncbi:MAG: hypothetical protein Q8885_02775, partial [Candidatus Phytoplasma stylosanthis]|nr:hypothetical protein [Candidatus Phytoplasma stylosanthis]
IIIMIETLFLALHSPKMMTSLDLLATYIKGREYLHIMTNEYMFITGIPVMLSKVLVSRNNF